MQIAASALALLAVLSLSGVLGLVFAPGETGVFLMVGGLVLFGVFAASAAVLFFGEGDQGL